MQLLERYSENVDWRGYTWLDSWLCGGSPLRDPATELLFKQGLPGEFRHLLMVNWGGGAWTSLSDSTAHRYGMVHSHCEDREWSRRNLQDADESAYWHCSWLPGGEVPPLVREVDGVLVRMWKEMEYNLVWFHELCKAVKPGTAIAFIGPKDEGIRNLEKRLSNYGDVETLAVGSHSRWISLRCPEALVLNDIPALSSGLFGKGETDAGTRLLLQHAGKVDNLSVCDLGCGSGAIAEWALKHGAKAVHACDHQYLAAQTAAERLRPFGDKAQVVCDFMGHSLPADSFDLVLTNPPFHLQSQTRLAIGQVWLAAARRLLAPQGKIRLVCNEFLEYPRFAADNGMQCCEVAHAQGFRIFEICL